MDVEREKQLAATAAAGFVEDGMTVGLGSGSTLDLALPPLAARGLDIVCVASSPGTETAARDLGLRLASFEGRDGVPHLDLAIDGADQVDRDGWLVKGGGAAHTREKRVAAAADRLVVVVSSNKVVERVGPPIPVELLAFGLAATLRDLGDVELRDVPRSPDGGVIVDLRDDVDDPARLAERLSSTPGVVEHGLFPPSMVWCVLIGRGDQVERRTIGGDR